MGSFSAPSPFSQGGTSNLYDIGFTFTASSPEKNKMEWSGPVEVPRWSRSAAKRALRLAGQTNFMSPRRLKEVLQLLGITRHGLAIAAEIRVGLVKDWLDGRRNIWPHIAKALEARVSEIYECADGGSTCLPAPSVNECKDGE